MSGMFRAAPVSKCSGSPVHCAWVTQNHSRQKICNAGSAATARHRAMSAASAQPCALHHEPQPVRQAPMPMQRVIMTRSRSRSAASALPASACQGKEASAAQESQKPRPCPAIPDIPKGPLVISAGWGRTGTSSLKVSALQSLRCQPVAAQSLAQGNGVEASVDREMPSSFH